MWRTDKSHYEAFHTTCITKLAANTQNNNGLIIIYMLIWTDTIWNALFESISTEFSYLH